MYLHSFYTAILVYVVCNLWQPVASVNKCAAQSQIRDRRNPKQQPTTRNAIDSKHSDYHSK